MSNNKPRWHYADTNSMNWQIVNDSQKLKFIGTTQGTGFILSEVPAGFEGPAHDHDGFEYMFVVEGSVISNGKLLEAGHGYIAEPGTRHEQFFSPDGAKFIVVFTFPEENQSDRTPS